MRRLEWRPRAQLDRMSIALHLGIELGAPQAAQQAVARIDQAIARILDFPTMGKVLDVPGLEKQGYRRVLAGSYFVFYRYEDDLVTICRILHQRQDICDYDIVSVS